MLTFGSLFAGIGGFDLGFERAGMQCKWQVEHNESCNRVLERHWPDAKRFGDVNDFSATTTAVRPDIICGGFPCQDLSVAGKRAGLAGERSGLFHQFMRIVGEFAPSTVVIENVPGLLSSNGGRDMLTVLVSLAELGYGFAYRILDAQWFGVAQRRRRVFIVGCLGDWRRAAEILFESESLPWDSAPIRESGPGVAACLTSGTATGSGVNKPGRRREDDVNLVSHSLSAEGADASEDGTGRGTPLIPIDLRQTSRGEKFTNNRVSGSGGPPGVGVGEAGDPAFTVSQRGQAIAYRDDRGRGNDRAIEDVTYPLHAAKGQSEQQCVAFQTRIGRNGRGQPKEITDALTSCDGGTHADSNPHVAGSLGVRRLTPRECERLQGFPDDHVRWDAGGKELSDSARYRMLGNAVAVPVAEWIGRRIVESERSIEHEHY